MARGNLLIHCIILNGVAGVTEAEKEKILHCVVVGGGPTGVEFSGELSDFIRRDVIRKFSHVKTYIKVTLIEVCLQALILLQRLFFFNLFQLLLSRK
jgi:NADH:ubiquinone reductase (non-electrogenic)